MSVQGLPADLSETSQGLFAKAMLIRAVERRLLELFGEGKLFGTVHTCIGQEWTGVAVAEALDEGDLIFTNHRGHGHFLARTGDVTGLIAEVMGRKRGICGGRGGSQHMCSGGVFSDGIQGGIVPVAAGLAMAEKLRGSGKIAVVFIGDGTLGEGGRSRPDDPRLRRLDARGREGRRPAVRGARGRRRGDLPDAALSVQPEARGGVGGEVRAAPGRRGGAGVRGPGGRGDRAGHRAGAGGLEEGPAAGVADAPNPVVRAAGEGGPAGADHIVTEGVEMLADG